MIQTFRPGQEFDSSGLTGSARQEGTESLGRMVFLGTGGWFFMAIWDWGILGITMVKMGYSYFFVMKYVIMKMAMG
jgi:hypothetical protein